MIIKSILQTMLSQRKRGLSEELCVAIAIELSKTKYDACDTITAFFHRPGADAVQEIAKESKDWKFSLGK